MFAPSMITAGQGQIFRFFSRALKLLLPLPHDHERCLETVIDLELIEYIGEMSFYRFFTDENLFADFLVGHALGDQPENFQLPSGETVDRFVVLGRYDVVDFTQGSPAAASQNQRP